MGLIAVALEMTKLASGITRADWLKAYISRAVRRPDLVPSVEEAAVQLTRRSPQIIHDSAAGLINNALSGDIAQVQNPLRAITRMARTRGHRGLAEQLMRALRGAEPLG